MLNLAVSLVLQTLRHDTAQLQLETNAGKQLSQAASDVLLTLVLKT
jgi:hypothetical protein